MSHGKHKMNKHWQKAADEAATLVPGGHDMAVAGVQRMYDAIEDAGTNSETRLQAALGVFQNNTKELSEQLVASKTPAAEGCDITEKLLKHTVKHIDEIKHSVLNGHRKD